MWGVLLQRCRPYTAAFCAALLLPGTRQRSRRASEASPLFQCVVKWGVGEDGVG